MKNLLFVAMATFMMAFISCGQTEQTAEVAADSAAVDSTVTEVVTDSAAAVTVEAVEAVDSVAK